MMKIKLEILFRRIAIEAENLLLGSLIKIDGRGGEKKYRRSKIGKEGI